MKKYFFILTACLTLGLAPYSAEPHIIGKLRWIFGGAHGMQLIDWGDALLHGAPWLALIFFGIREIWIRRKTTAT